MHSPMGIHDVGINNMSSDATKTNFASISDTVQLVQGVITFLLNILLFLLILSQKKLRRKISYQLFLNLQISHMLLCVLIITSELYESTWEDFYILVVIGNAILMEMFISLMIYSGDRLFAINLPFTHKFVKFKHVLVTLISSWVFPITFAILALTLHIIQHHMTIIATVMIGSAAIMLAVSNLIVYITAAKHDRFLRENTGHRSKHRKTYTGKKMLKASYACIGVVSSFVLCWLPYFLHNTLTLVKVYRPGSKKAFTIVAEQMALLNSLLDPVLFVLLARDARRVILKLLNIRRSDLEESTTLRLTSDHTCQLSGIQDESHG